MVAEQVLRLRRLGKCRPRRHDPRGQQADQRKASGDEHRHLGPVTGGAVHGDQGGGQDRHAERRTALPGRGQQRAGRALGLGRDRPVRAGQGGGDLAEASGDPEHELGREQRGQRTGQHRDGGPGQGQQRDGEGDSQRAPWPEGRDEPASRAGQRERPGRLRDEAQTGEYRAEPSPLLQVQRHQQYLPGDEGADRYQGEVGSGDAAVFKQGQVEQR